MLKKVMFTYKKRLKIPKEVISRHKSSKDRQCNDEKKEDKKTIIVRINM